MNKQSKQFIIKLAIIVGVLILSAFITSTYGYFTPKHGDASVGTDLPGGKPSYYTYEDLVTVNYLCGNTNNPDKTSSSLAGTEGYSVGNYRRNHGLPLVVLDAARSQREYTSHSVANIRIPGGYMGNLHVNGLTASLRWVAPTAPKWIGNRNMIVTIPDNNRVFGSVDSDGSPYLSIEGNITVEHSVPWQQAGGLNQGQLKKFVINRADYLDTMRHIYNSNGFTTDFTLRDMGFDTLLDDFARYTRDWPIHTTVLGEAVSAPIHQYGNDEASETVFNYIYAEASLSASADGAGSTEYTPVQYANWYALGQSPDIHDPAASRGKTIYQEAKEYEKFLTATEGKMKKEFIDVVEKGKIQPVEVSSDKEGNVIVGPFAVKYTEWGIDAGRGWVQFAGIYGAKVFTNDKPDGEGLAKSEYEFIYKNDKRKTSNLVDPQYPHSEEVFWVKIKKANNRTDLRGIHFDFRFLNVSGGAKEMTQTLYFYKWTFALENGNYYIKGEPYPGDANGQSSGPEQNLVYDIHGSRSYTHSSLDYSMYPVKLTLTKHVVNANDNNSGKVNDHNFDLGKTYKFMVTLHATAEQAASGSNPLASYTINLKDDDIESITYYVENGISVPYYRVVETDDGGSDLPPIFNVKNGASHKTFDHGVCGQLSQKDTVAVLCYNRYVIKSAEITLSKELREPAVEDEVYRLNLDITEGADRLLTDLSSAIQNSVELRVAKGQRVAQVYVDNKAVGPKVSFNYFWRGNAPSYKVTEEENAKYIVTFNGTSVDKIEGKFEDKFNGKVSVDAVNSRVKSKIAIAKEATKPLEPGDKKTYYFRVKVGSSINEMVTLVLENENKRVEMKNPIDVTLDNVKGDHYTIIEYPDQDSMLQSKDGKTVDEGILTAEDGTDKARYTKTAVNELGPHHVSIDIKKTFEKGEPEDDLVFTFDVDAKQGNTSLGINTLKASKENNWTSETARYEYDYGTEKPVITIAEKQDSKYLIKGFKAINKKDGLDVTGACTYTIDQDKNTVTLTEYPVDVELSFEVLNYIKGYHAEVVINKMVSGIAPNDNNEYTFDFVLNVEKDGFVTSKILHASNLQTASEDINWDEGQIVKIDIYEIKREGFSLTKLLVNNEEQKIKEETGKGIIVVEDYQLTPGVTEVLVDAENKADNKGSIKIKKLLKDEDGELVLDSSQSFTFNIEVQRADGSTYDDNVTVPVNGEYNYTATWTGENAPTYKISEISTPGYKIESVVGGDNVDENNVVTGSFKKDDTVEVTYTNRAVRKLEGDLTITKTIASTTGYTIPDDYTKTYSFDVVIKQNNEVKKTETVSVTVSGREVSASKTISYSWESDQPTPEYEVTENGDTPIAIIKNDGTRIEGQRTVTGVLTKDSKVNCEFINGIKVNSGKIKLSKSLESESYDINETFYFNVKIAGDNLPVVPLKVGQLWTSEVYTWVDGEAAPEFTITETTPKNSVFKRYDTNNIADKREDGSTISGRLVPMDSNESSVEINCINGTDQKKANVTITKKGTSSTVKNVSEDDLRNKYGGRDFAVDVSVVYNGGRYFVGNTEYSPEKAYKTRIYIDVGETISIPEIRWFGNSEAPKVIVNELSTAEDGHDGWKLLNYSDNNVVLVPNETKNIVIENEFGNKSLTIPMGGTVWIDDVKNEKNTKNSVVNGIMEEDEVGVPNVGVVVKRYLVNASDTIIGDSGYAKAYDLDGNQIEVFPIYTDETGRWDIRDLEIPGVTEEEAGRGVVAIKYGVEYIYDGYTYEPTIYISDKDDYSNDQNPIQKANGSAITRGQAYYSATVAKRNSLSDRSFALDNASSRTDFNNRFETISGDTPIASDNSTSGYAIGTNGSRMELKYTGTQVVNGNNTSLVSELVTTDDAGRALEQYQVKAYTLWNNTNPVSKKVSDSGLAYPFDLEFNVAISSRRIGDKSIPYVATDPYLRNINLGLARREDADLEVTKDVDSAKVIVNQRLFELQKVSVLDKLANNNYFSIETNVNGDTEEISYELGLYRSDYYYKAQAYATSRDVYNGLKKFYKEIELGDDFEALMNMQAYVTYKITIRNSSPSTAYDVVAKSIMDYADSSLELVRTRVTNYIKKDGNSVGELTEIANAPYYKTDNKQSGIVLGPDTLIKDTVASRSYYRTEMAFDEPVKLESGKSVTIYATYRLKNYSQDENSQKLVNADGSDEFNAQVLNANADGIILGNKANIAELKAYSVYKHNTYNLAGRLDRDSAPNNIDIVARNAKEYYEDDTYSAPTINVKINDGAIKTISGTVFEDNELAGNDVQTNGVALGDGIKSDDEKIIKGMNVELVEKIQIPTNNGSEYKEYDFTWPENYDIDKNIVSADDSIASSLKALTKFDATISSDENGAYTFNNMPTGSYVVRFHYGDINGDYNNESVTFATGSKLLKSDVYKFPDESGGDYTKSEAALSKTNTSHYDGDILPAVYNGHDFKSAAYALGLNDEWLGNDGGTEIRSKAADSQARRLELVNKAKVLVNANTSLLDTANDIEADHSKLYEEYSMFADTPKIRIDANVEDANNNNFKNVNFGIVERPETRLVLDKEIEEISLLDNTEKELIKIKYDINYDNAGVITQLDDGSYMLTNPAAAVTVNEAESFGLEYLQSLSKIENKYSFLNPSEMGNSGVQNFRYIVYDTSMATSLTLKTTYRLTALNLGQADRTSAALQAMSSDDIYAVAQILKANKFSGNDARTYNGLTYGEYTINNGEFKSKDGKVTINLNENRFTPVLGYTYYSSSVNDNDAVVNTKVGQIIDYIDNGLRFDQSINTADNNSWYSTTDDYLYHNDVIDKKIFQTVNYNLLQGDAATSETKSKVMDKAGVYYDTTSSHNIVLSVQNSAGETNARNTDIMKRLLPKSKATNTAEQSYAFIKLNTTKSIDSQAEDLIFDNIAEVIKYENDVGRKTTTTVAGNADPRGSKAGNTYLGEFSGSLAEIDSSATEIITFSEPYGISERGRYITEISIGVLSALVIIAAGIVIVKKKVL